MSRGGSRYGAGRPGWHIKAEHCLRLRVQDLTRRKLLDGSAFTWRWTNTSTGKEVGAISMVTRPGNVRLIYAHDRVPINEDVRIVSTACNFGGSRPWFLCPRCNRRIGVLLVRSGRFMCRHCAQAAYACQSEDLIGRTWRRQSKLEARLGEHWRRPKRMHRATHDRLLAAIMTCEDVRECAIAAFIHRSGLTELWGAGAGLR